MTEEESRGLANAKPQWYKDGLTLKEPQFAFSAFESRPGVPVVHQPTRMPIPGAHIMDDSCPLGPYTISGTFTFTGPNAPPSPGAFSATMSLDIDSYPACVYVGEFDFLIGGGPVFLKFIMNVTSGSGAAALGYTVYFSDDDFPIYEVGTTGGGANTIVGAYADCSTMGTGADTFSATGVSIA